MTHAESVAGVAKSLFPPRLPKPLRRVRKELEKTAKVGKVVSSAGNVTELFTTLSKGVGIGLKTARVPVIFMAPFFIKDCLDDVIRVCTKQTIQERVRAAFSFVVNSDSVTTSIAATCAQLKFMKLVGEQAIRWIPIFNIVSFVVSFLSLGLAAESLVKSKKLYQILNDTERKLRTCTNDQERATVLIAPLREIEILGITDVRRKMLISKKTNLESRIKSVVQRLESEAERRIAVEEGTKLVSTLKGRATTTLTYTVLNVAIKIITIIGTGLLFFPPTAPVGVIILAATATAALVHFIGKCYFIKKDPFTEDATCKAYELYERISSSLKSIRIRLEGFVVAKKAMS